jgi:hypothetical protein
VGRTSLSPKWTITPVGGADKVPTFVALLGAQHGMKVATLLDIQRKDEQTIENLYKRKLLKKQNVHTYSDFTGSSEADIEDMFTVDFYLKLVNKEYSSNLSGPIQPAQLKSAAPRILARLEKFFTQNPLKNGAQFNHYRPARYFVENVAQIAKEISSETLDRFEAAFKALNALL